MGAMRRIRRLLGLSLTLTLTIPVAESSESGDLGAGSDRQVPPSRAGDRLRLSAGIHRHHHRMHRTSDQWGDGLSLLPGDLIEDPSVDPLQPEGLVYESQPNGKRRSSGSSPDRYHGIRHSRRRPSSVRTCTCSIRRSVGTSTLPGWKHNPSGVFSRRPFRRVVLERQVNSDPIVEPCLICAKRSE